VTLSHVVRPKDLLGTHELCIAAANIVRPVHPHHRMRQ